MPFKSKDAEKKAFVTGFVQGFYRGIGQTKSEFVRTKAAAYLMEKAAAAPMNLEEVLQQPGDPRANMPPPPPNAGPIARGPGDPSFNKKVIATVGGPFALGGAMGFTAARAMSPSNDDVKNMEKEELLGHYDQALKELNRRMLVRRSR